MSTNKKDIKTPVERPLSDMHDDGVHFNKDVRDKKKAKAKPKNQPDPDKDKTSQDHR